MKAVFIFAALFALFIGVNSQPFDFPPKLVQNFAIGDENYVIWWAGAALQGARFHQAGPAATARALAIVGVSLYDTINAFIPPRWQFYFRNVTAPAGAHPLAAITGAGFEIMNLLYPAQAEDWRVIYKTQIDLLKKGFAQPTPLEITLGYNFGRDVAAAIYNSRLNDGHNDPGTFVPVNPPGPGNWRPSPPNFRGPLFTTFANITPFVLQSVEQFRPEGPSFAFPSTYVRQYREIFIKGVHESFGPGRRTILETFVGTFFSVDQDGEYTPPGQYWDTAIEMARDGRFSPARTARLLAYSGLAMADAAFTAWHTKYFFGDWRPQSAINFNVNPELTTDPTWEPLIETPGFPDYISGHSTIGSSVGTVWQRFFDTDTYEFEITSDSLPGVKATYRSFQQFIDDNAYSRVYGGVHFRKSCQDGVSAGNLVGNYVFNNVLLPL